MPQQKKGSHRLAVYWRIVLISCKIIGKMSLWEVSIKVVWTQDLFDLPYFQQYQWAMFQEIHFSSDRLMTEWCQKDRKVSEQDEIGLNSKILYHLCRYIIVFSKFEELHWARLVCSVVLFVAIQVHSMGTTWALWLCEALAREWPLFLGGMIALFWFELIISL